MKKLVILLASMCFLVSCNHSSKKFDISINAERINKVKVSCEIYDGNDFKRVCLDYENEKAVELAKKIQTLIDNKTKVFDWNFAFIPKMVLTFEQDQKELEIWVSDFEEKGVVEFKKKHDLISIRSDTRILLLVLEEVKQRGDNCNNARMEEKGVD